MILPLTAGCAIAPSVPPDPQLRDLAVRYVQSAARFQDSPVVRAQAMEAAVWLGAQAKPLLREGVSDPHAGVRFAAGMALGSIRDTASLAAMQGLLADPDPSARIAASYFLEVSGDQSQRARWADALLRHDQASVRADAALALGRLEDKRAIPLLEVASSADAHEGVRLQALEALALLGHRQAIDRFVHDAYGGVGHRQVFALLALGGVTDERVLPTLRTRLAGATYLEARLAAARSLGRLGYDDGYILAVQSLNWDQPQQGLPDDPPQNQVMRVRSMAAMALGEIGDHRALGWLKQRMETPDDPRVQLAAATAILMILGME